MNDLDLFVRISRLVPGLPGWCDVSKAHTLAAAVISLRPEITVEIGIYGGRSFLPLAMAHKHVGKGLCVGIDPWHPAESVKGQLNPSDAKFWGESAQHDLVYAKFMETLHSLDLERCTRIMRMTSDQVEPPRQIDILSLDGNHGETVLRDTQRFGMRVRSGGLIFMDDLNWTGGFVKKAMEMLIGAGFSRLYDIGTGCVLQRG